tara:strand:- start:22867 stop:23853 length:987 start_codon:yes stop_codon:yes gene_type:complete
MMKKYAVSTLLLLVSSVAFPYDNATYVAVLEWDKKWDKVLARATDSYIERIGSDKSAFKSETERNEKLEYIRSHLLEALGWNNVGEAVTNKITQSCDKYVLDGLVNITTGKTESSENRGAIISSYRNCMKAGLNKSLGMIQEEIVRLKSTRSSRSPRETPAGDSILIDEDALDSYRNKYIKATDFKALAQSESGAWGWRSGRTSELHAISSALAVCRSNNHKDEGKYPCKVININGEWNKEYRDDPVVSHDTQQDERQIISSKALISYLNEYRSASEHKAFAQSHTGAWSWKTSKLSQDDATSKALAGCRRNNHKYEDHYPCEVLSVK